jgi:hypothetical protein
MNSTQRRTSELRVETKVSESFIYGLAPVVISMALRTMHVDARATTAILAWLRRQLAISTHGKARDGHDGPEMIGG